MKIVRVEDCETCKMNKECGGIVNIAEKIVPNGFRCKDIFEG